MPVLLYSVATRSRRLTWGAETHMYSFLPELLEHAIEKTSAAAHRSRAGRKTWEEGSFTAISTTIAGEKLAAESDDGSLDRPLFRSPHLPVTQSPKLIPTELA